MHGPADEVLQQDRFYTVEAPGTIRFNSKYTVAVSLLQADESCAISVTLSGANYHEQKLVDVSPESTEMVVFEVPKLEIAEYFLEVCGSAVLNFTERIQLNFMEEKPLVYIQLDKQGFKRADKVDFRVIFLDSNVRPAQIELPIRIVIQQNEENIVAEFSNIELVNGMYTGQWVIGDDVPFGIYIIDVQIGEHAITSKCFEIIEYEEPKFNIVINTVRRVRYESAFIKLSVEAKYADGAPVKGRCIVSIRSIGGYFGLGGRTIAKYADIDGVVTDIIFDIENELCIRKEFLTKPYFRTASLALEVTVDAEAEGAKETLTEILTITKQNLADGVDNDGECISCGGWSAFTSSCDVESNKPITLNVLNDEPRTGDIISCEVLLKKPTTYFVYFVTARGNIVHSEFVSLKDAEEEEQEVGTQRKYTISLETTFQLVPRAFLLAYFVYEGELFFDEIGFNLKHDFENKLEIENPSSADVGDEIELQIKSSPNSLVGLMAVDTNSVLLESANDICSKDIFKALHKIRSQTPWLDGFGEYPGIVSGLVTFTNATWHGFTKGFFAFRGYVLGDADGWNQRLSDREHMEYTNNNYGIDVNREKKEVQRKIQELNQPLGNWIFFDRDTDDDGCLTVTEQLPENATTWLLTVISINSSTGFTMTETPIKIKATTGSHEVALETSGDSEVDDTLQLICKSRDFEVDLYEHQECSYSYEIDIPTNCKVLTTEFSVHSNLLGPTLAELADYAGLMYYTGMLHMTTVIPNVVVLEYLQSQDELDSELAEDIISKLKEAIQREVAAVLEDGSFGWASRDEKGSPHVTAVIIATFQRASKFIEIDAEIIERGLDYLAFQQTDGGDFVKAYIYPYKYPFQTELGVGLAALVLLAFLQNKENLEKYGSTVDLAFEYIVANLTATSSRYDLAVAFYAMQLAEHPAADALKERLLSCASTEANSNRKWWTYSEDNSDAHLNLSVSNLEVSSYVALGLLVTESVESLVPIIKWLIPYGQKFGEYNVRAESMDCALGLDAVLKFAVKSGSCTGVTNIDYVADILMNEEEESEEYSCTGRISVEPRNAMITKTHLLPKSTRQVTLSTVDKGSFIGSLTSRYIEI